MRSDTVRVLASCAVVAILATDLWRQDLHAQPPAGSPSRIVIPFLANATKPADLEFEGAECETDAGGARLDCAFQQVFLTTSPVAPDTCLVTTNRYERSFRREGPNRWVSVEGPSGDCGLIDAVTLRDDGGVRWTMEVSRVATKKNASPACRSQDDQLTTLSWQNIRRPLPCRFVQPGGLGR